ncbi:MAG: HNH endonuclease [Lachnospiraceae bacterium]|nr:HNH endonuclease [Lachnospiraceae bacterium]
MNYYRGLENDVSYYGGSNDDKFEFYNFLPHLDKYIGFVEPQGSIHVERLGAGKTDDYAEDVLVVWLATSPEKGTRIVGWYKNATVYRNFQPIPGKYLKVRDDERINLYNISAEEAVLLDPDNRDFIIESGPHRPGRKHIWYGEEELNAEVLDYIESYDIDNKTSEIEEIIRENYDAFEKDYHSTVEKVVNSFKEEYPKNGQILQKKLIGDGIRSFYNRLKGLVAYDGQILKFDDHFNEENTSDIAYCTAMLILNEDNKDTDLIDTNIVARLLSIYYPEKYLNITDEDAIELALDDVGLLKSENLSVWEKHLLLRKWIAKKIGILTDDPIFQNYVFVRCLKKLVGIEYLMEKQIEYAKLNPLESEIHREYEAIDHNENEDLQSHDVDSGTDDLEHPEYSREPQPRILLEEQDAKGRPMPLRDPAKKRNAMILAGYKCENDPNHKTFISRGTGKPYVESHHLIPMEYYNDFEYSLDVEENIVCLCSNCHNEIHYGVNNADIVRKLFMARRELLHDAGLDITEDELLKAYRTNVDDSKTSD